MAFGAFVADPRSSRYFPFSLGPLRRRGLSVALCLALLALGCASPPAPADTASAGTASAPYLPPLPPEPAPIVWLPDWADEFESPGLPDPAFWGYDVGGHGWGNGELQYYTRADARNARVEEGRLVIEARVNEGQLPPGTFGFYKDYTSARLVTRGLEAFGPGTRIEVAARLPKGRGLWPAVWLLPTEDRYGQWPGSGEIGLMEHVGFEPGLVHATVHTRAYNHLEGNQRGAAAEVTGLAEDFHVYALEWREERLDFYVDGARVFSYLDEGTGDSAWPFDKEFYLVLNLAVGGAWGGQQGVDPESFPARLEIDYVRSYKASPAEPGEDHC